MSTTTDKKKINRRKMTYQLAQVHRVPSMQDETGSEVNEDAGEVQSYEPLPLPEGVDESSRDSIKRGLAKAIREGNTDYDGKELVILTFTESFKIQVKTTRSVTLS